MERSASCSFKPICTRHGKGCERLECANKTPGGLTDAGGRRAGTGVQEHAPGNTCDTMRGHRVRGSVCTIEKAAAGGQQLRSRSRSPDGWCTWRGSPKHLRKQPRCASGAQHRGSRGLCGCIARAGKTTDGPAGHLPRRPRSGRRTRASWPTSARTRTSFKLWKKTTQDAARCADNRRHCRWENPCRQPGVIYNRASFDSC